MKSSLRNKLSVLVQRRLIVERRSGRRIKPTHRTVCLIQAPDGQCSTGFVQNLSHKGVAVQTDHDYPLETPLHVLLVNEAHTFSLALDMKVVRCLRVGSQQYVLAGPFGRALRHDELIPFIV